MFTVVSFFLRIVISIDIFVLHEIRKTLKKLDSLDLRTAYHWEIQNLDGEGECESNLNVRININLYQLPIFSLFDIIM